jgi:N-acetyl-gamma-glutamyl-phosphate reductase
MTVRLGLIGARGHTGAELLRLIDRHPLLELACAGSRAWAGSAVAAHGDVRSALHFEALTPADVAERDLDAVLLALPNEASRPYVEALTRDSGPMPLIVDISADHRFDDRWYYGLPELTGHAYAGERTIANPGCYATAMQLAIAPLLPHLTRAPACFGISGYSGAGTSPSRRNDPEVLRDNILPYALAGHLHEREVTRHLKHPVAFCPHVASFFRGINLTVTLWLDQALPAQAASERYRAFYADAPLVEVTDEIPEVRDIVGRPGAVVGGFAADPSQARVTVVCTLDNLLKGAAVQAIQNVNTGLDLPVLEGLSDD